MIKASPKAALGRCPKCCEVIELSTRRCRFCNATFNSTQVKEIAAAFEATNQTIAAKNDSRAMWNVLWDFMKDVGHVLYAAFFHHPWP